MASVAKGISQGLRPIFHRIASHTIKANNPLAEEYR
jgi:hypothetical protein